MSHVEGAGLRPSSREELNRRAARWRWMVGIVVALLFHGGLLALTRIQIAPKLRTDRINPRSAWVGDRMLLEEGTMRGQEMALFDETPLFLPTAQNFTGLGQPIEDARPPGEIFERYEPVLVMPQESSPPGLVVAPADQEQPVSVVQQSKWPYLAQFEREDPGVRVTGRRLARVEVCAIDTGELAMAVSVPVDVGQGAQGVWPDWRPFELFVSVSETGRMSEPIMLGGGSGSPDLVDPFLRDFIRNRMRLDLQLGPGTYRIVVGP